MRQRWFGGIEARVDDGNGLGREGCWTCGWDLRAGPAKEGGGMPFMLCCWLGSGDWDLGKSWDRDT